MFLPGLIEKTQTFSSDHRLVRSTYNLGKPIKSRAIFCNKWTALSNEENQQEYLETLKQKAPGLTWETSDDIETYYDREK
ncbi:UDP-N-acetylmuramoylalanine--D-glutamate ligase [Operophtera brumata]|uniref:UDP-N-acetylmuramoylalanine--D-glutamate ligase n=1 Tax=Operophtera brumata TaxID=104452 RepID=A0A0L7LUR6_OPEBR|nr:UDP-N-acetylmuramoylalanine--D-glutamate ligase [Operophtera brumata]